MSSYIVLYTTLLFKGEQCHNRRKSNTEEPLNEFSQHDYHHLRRVVAELIQC